MANRSLKLKHCAVFWLAVGIIAWPAAAADRTLWDPAAEGRKESPRWHPQFVGTHWFQWQDEPTTGRAWDEENYQIGLVDIADTPYRETVDAVREVGLRMYRWRAESR